MSSIRGIPVMRPLLPRAGRLAPYLREIDETRLYSNWGPLVRRLQTRLERRLRLPDGAMVCAGSGTAALSAAIFAKAGAARGGRNFALLPDYTFIATAFAAEACGYELALSNVDNAAWMLTPRDVLSRSDLHRIGVVVVASPYGRPVAQQPWIDFEHATGVPVVIDGAASLDTSAADPAKFLGPLPVAFSFHATKSFATGEGGGVATTDLDLAQKIARALNFGFYNGRIAEAPGLNGKMSEYHAAVGHAELDGWDEKLSGFQNAALLYRLQFARLRSKVSGVFSPDVGACYALCRFATANDAEAAQKRLRVAGVDFRFWYGYGLHGHPVYAGRDFGDRRSTETLAQRIVGLPMSADLTEDDIVRVANALQLAAQDLAVEAFVPAA